MTRIRRASTFALRHRPPGPDRRGAFLVVALICLVLATALVASVLKVVQAQQRHCRRQLAYVQATWLADSGLERAVSRLRADHAYAGETWSIAASDLGGGDAANVTIRIEPAPDQPQARIVAVEAVYPAGDSAESIRQTRQATITLSQES